MPVLSKGTNVSGWVWRVEEGLVKSDTWCGNRDAAKALMVEYE
jgi:hypothetical protein